MKEITSPSNATVKLIKSLGMSKYRKETGMYVVEGTRLVEEAMNYKKPKYIVYSKTYADSCKEIDDDAIIVTDSIFNGLCDTISPQGILAVMDMDKGEGAIIDSGVVVALENVQNPLNVGTVIRTADALGASGILLSKDCADIYSPKVLRGMMGSLYHIPIICTENFYNTLADYKKRGFSLVAGDLKGGAMEKPQGSSVLIIGNEGNGITDEVRNMCDVLWRINMPGKAESLNAAVAAGIMLYTLTN